MTSIQKNINQSAELYKLESSLWLDFNKYSEINIQENKLQFSSDLDSVHYSFSKKYITKNIDTFFIAIENKQVFFKGKKTINSTIDAIKLQTSKAFQNQEVFIYKQNDATTFMN